MDMELDNIEYVSTSDGIDDEEIHHHPKRGGGGGGTAAFAVPPATSVHELLECPVCTNSMYPPIHQEDTADDNERCGICTDVVIDRGVLDCCDHWFCFACIDNWATITNLCPLCKNEFQLITCLPVYDTVGNIKSEDYALSRDDDWHIQGKNNALSFPSYYIDEDAVTCLDGDGCKIRSGLSIAEEDLTLDTSIACDSCDVWYHAFCVGFNPECGASENSWLCPRCITDESLEKSNAVPSQNIGNYTTLNADTMWTTDPSFSSKVSVSIADDGETAVVVSMVEGQQKPENIVDSISEVHLNCSTDKETEAFLLDSRSGYAKPDVQLENRSCTEVIPNSLNYRTDPLFSSKVSVSVDDDGETAMVVSMVEGQQKQEHIEAELNLNTEKETEMFCTDKSSGNAKLNVQLENSGHSKLFGNNLICSNEKGSKDSALEDEKNSEICLGMHLKEKMLVSPSLEDTTSELSSIQAEKDLLQSSLTASVAKRVSFPSHYSVTGNDLKPHIPAGMKSKPSSSGQVEVPSVLLCASATNSQTSGSKSDTNFHSGQSISASSGNTIVNIGEDMIDIPPKHAESSDLTSGPTEDVQPHMIDDGHLKKHKRKREMDVEHLLKKAKSDGKSQLPSTCQVDSSALDSSKRVPSNTPHLNDTLRNALPKKTRPPDIMSIVKEVDRRCSEGPAGALDKSTARRENSSGLRVKKIMRRAGEKEESSILVQKLREEIREAVRDKASNNNDIDNDFDVKLLTAFRAAIVKPKDEIINKNATSCRSLKKSLLQKGKSRENLTKKIYGASNGRRKRTWDRDWEIEFWKHRCTRTKPEKVETLHSVLELLKKATNSCSNDSTTDEGPEGETNSILSRVYLADTSLFPRKDDIKPLSAFAGSSPTHSDGDAAKIPTGISRCLPQVKAFSSNNKQSSIVRTVESTSLSDSSGSKVRELGSSKEVISLSDSSKVDKRKWAMEVLARKNALINSRGSKEEDKSALKGYPLLAQLPVDMRPVPEPSRHNKVPLSVRQAQLYRITEHFLRRTKLAVIRRTADTELAVADAINIEKGIFERSNSKLVYVNLCSQALSQRISKPPSAETIASNSSAPTVEVANQMSEETLSNPSVGGWSKIDEALKLAGLSSDSPPNSPSRSTIKDFDVENNPNGESRKQGPENVLDLDSHPELDKYGECEHACKDDSCERLKLQHEQNRHSESKAVFSTLGCDEPQDPKPQHSNTKEVAFDQNNCNVKMEDGAENGTKEVKMGELLLPKACEGEMHEEPLFAERKELYGPDDNPFANKVPDEHIGEPSNSMEIVAAGDQPKDGASGCEFENECCADNSFAAGRENSPVHSMESETGLKEKRGKLTSNEVPDPSNSIFKKVEAYVKEHIRPLCKSGVITVDQYRWAVGKTTQKVMKYHHKAKNASFLIKEGEKVKKLALQYVEASQRKDG